MSYTQKNRELTIVTSLGPDVLLLTGLRGHEGISQLFSFELDLLSELETEIAFDQIIGQNVTVEMLLPTGDTRYFNGLVNRFTEGGHDETFARFRATLVPQLWLLTKQVRSRIFQQLSVPDILRKVLAGLNVDYQLTAHYYPRDFCVQYGESDFAFVSRLMEAEGILYFFKHAEREHQLVITDSSNRPPSIASPTSVPYEELQGGVQEAMKVTSWEKTQELRAGTYTVWDHTFELPGNPLEAKVTTVPGVKAGTVKHSFALPANKELEIYEYGEYAQRFGGVDPNGIPRPRGFEGLLDDRHRTATVRMQEEEAAGFHVTGVSNCGNFLPGHKFCLRRHFNGDDSYLLTRVEHEARVASYSHRDADGITYTNTFTCIPVALPYRPVRVTPKPSIPATQTATVVGPVGEQLFCDKYGRVKVQFHWDREGKNDNRSSCWLRVAQIWAGNNWGAFFWPRIGHEVVVTFENGDPDQPLIVGSVYNAHNQPPFPLPKKKNLAGIKSLSMSGSPSKNFNGVVFDDNTGKEHVTIYSEKHLTLHSELEKMLNAGRHKHERVTSISLTTVGTLPGGGSGGGDDTYKPFNPDVAEGIFGMNGIVVYGENLQAALGMNHQIAVGSNYQMCINPGGFAAGTAEAKATGLLGGLEATAFAGTGVGGNMQFTIGTSANVVLGREFDINLGPAKITIAPGENSIVSIRLCEIIGVAYGLWLLLYIIENNAVRSTLCILFQVLIEGLMYALMQEEMMKQKADDDGARTIAQAAFEAAKACLVDKQEDLLKNHTFFAGEGGPDLPGSAQWGWGVSAAVGAALFPLAMDTVTADRDDNDSGDSNNSSTSSSSNQSSNKGGGSGGGSEVSDYGRSVDGEYAVSANQITFLTRPPLPPALPGPELITILAMGLGMDGLVNVRGSQGVRITAGPPPLPATYADSTNGVEVAVGELQNITLQRGLLPVDQTIEMTPSGITVDAGTGAVTIQSLTQITLSVAGGLSSITLTPEGITLQGVLIQIN